MGEYADEMVSRMLGEGPLGGHRHIKDEGVLAYYAYWDGEYAKPEAWRVVMSRQAMEQTDKALLVTLEDGTQMWVPKSICQSWSARKFTVHIEHYDRLLAEHNSSSDMLPDLPDEEETE